MGHLCWLSFESRHWALHRRERCNRCRSAGCGFGPAGFLTSRWPFLIGRSRGGPTGSANGPAEAGSSHSAWSAGPSASGLGGGGDHSADERASSASGASVNGRFKTSHRGAGKKGSYPKSPAFLSSHAGPLGAGVLDDGVAQSASLDGWWQRRYGRNADSVRTCDVMRAVGGPTRKGTCPPTS